MTDLFRLATDRGIKLNLDLPPPRHFEGDEKKTEKLNRVIAKIRGLSDSEGRVHPLYRFTPNGRITCRNPNYGVLPWQYIEGTEELLEIGIYSLEVIIAAKLRGEGVGGEGGRVGGGPSLATIPNYSFPGLVV